MYFIICSNVYDEVTNFEVSGVMKTQRSKLYAENLM